MSNGIDLTGTDPERLKDPKVKQLLEEAGQILVANPLEGYFPHGKQVPFHQFKGPIKAFIGGNRTGKSTGGVNDDIIQAIDEEAVPAHLRTFKKWQPPFYCRIITPDFTRTMIAVQEAIRKWVPKNQLKGGGWGKAYEKQSRLLHFENGSFFEFMTFEQDIDKFGGSARHRIHYDEELPGEKGQMIRQECLMRLIDYGGDEVFTYTPLLGLSWTLEEIWDAKGPEVQPSVWRDENMCVVQVDMDENPHLSAEARDRILESIPEQYRKARKEGNYIHFEGLVYPEFDPDVHVIDPLKPADISGHSIQIVVDPGIVKTAVSFWAFDKQNKMRQFDELLLSDSTPERTVKQIRRKEGLWYPNGASSRPLYLIDPAAAARAPNGRTIESLFQEAGLPVIRAQNAVEAGVMEVKRRLDRQLLEIARNCVNTLQERERYRLQLKPDGQFGVVKRNDHLMDTMRYAAMQRPIFPSKNRRRQAWTPGTAPPMSYFLNNDGPDPGPTGAMS